MESTKPIMITVEAIVQAPIEKVWKCWTEIDHIIHWNNASPDWHTPKSENDLQPGGKFVYRMEARDGSFGFDFGGTYDEVKHQELISLTLGDERKMKVAFISQGKSTKVIESFEAEAINSIELQRGGWQAILDSFKKYTESH